MLERYRHSEGQIDLFSDETCQTRNFHRLTAGSFHWVALAIVSLIMLLVFSVPLLAEHTHEHMKLHRDFYSNWMQPKNPDMSCCSNRDCAPTRIKYIGGIMHVRSQWTGDWLPVDEDLVDRRVVPPDGRSHACIVPPTPSAYSASEDERVLCVAIGAGM